VTIVMKKRKTAKEGVTVPPTTITQPEIVRTLADLARIAGVSTGTVSRALADKSIVNSETRERIQSLAKKHDFRPNQMASKLRSRHTGFVGVVIPLGHERRQHISDPFFLTLLGHLADELAECGYDLMLSRVIPDGTKDWLEKVTRSGMVDGVLVIGQSDQFDIIEEVAAQYEPLVIWGHQRAHQRHCVVGTDNLAGGRLAVEHLVATGARKLLFMGDAAGIEIQMRLEGAKAAAAAAGIALKHVKITLAGEDMGPQIEKSLSSRFSYDGIVAASDLIALSALSALHRIGKRIPQDVQVVGFDDLPLSSYSAPPLTTIRQEISRGAKLMVEKLKERMGGKNTPSVVMPPILVVRESTRSL